MRSYVAEAIGTFALVFLGTGAIVVDEIHGSLGHVGVSLTFGLAIMTMIFAVGHISGAHFNPAVTLGFAVVGRFPLSAVPLYWVSQVLGAVAGSAAVSLLFGDAGNFGATTPGGTDRQSFVLEMILTAFLMLVIIAVATDNRAAGSLAAVAIGGAVAMGALMGGPISGASMNPARSLGPALVSGNWGGLWIYLMAPAIGAACAAVLYEYMRRIEPAKEVVT